MITPQVTSKILIYSLFASFSSYHLKIPSILRNTTMMYPLSSPLSPHIHNPTTYNNRPILLSFQPWRFLNIFLIFLRTKKTPGKQSGGGRKECCRFRYYVVCCGNYFRCVWDGDCWEGYGGMYDAMLSGGVSNGTVEECFVYGCWKPCGRSRSTSRWGCYRLGKVFDDSNMVDICGVYHSVIAKIKWNPVSPKWETWDKQSARSPNTSGQISLGSSKLHLWQSQHWLWQVGMRKFNGTAICEIEMPVGCFSEGQCEMRTRKKAWRKKHEEVH